MMKTEPKVDQVKHTSTGLFWKFLGLSPAVQKTSQGDWRFLKVAHPQRAKWLLEVKAGILGGMLMCVLVSGIFYSWVWKRKTAGAEFPMDLTSILWQAGKMLTARQCCSVKHRCEHGCECGCEHGHGHGHKHRRGHGHAAEGVRAEALWPRGNCHSPRTASSLPGLSSHRNDHLRTTPPHPLNRSTPFWLPLIQSETPLP